MRYGRLLAYNDKWDYCAHQSSQGAIHYASNIFVSLMEEAIKNRGVFRVALSGGSTPKQLFAQLKESAADMPWHQVELYWSDERCVPPDSSDSNYKMAMDTAFSALPLMPANIFRMEGEIDPKTAARKYNTLLEERASGGMDLTLLGIGDDCHTASLFPNTHALSDKDRLATANFVPKLRRWRLTFTYEMINRSKHIMILCLGESKREALRQALFETTDINERPIQGVGTPRHKALWIVDDNAIASIAL